MATFAVLFVCKANLCRSPSAHGVLRKLVAQHGLALSVSVDSAGTHERHPGSPPDERSCAHAARRGYDLSDLRARRISLPDFEAADLILVMDDDNLRALQVVCPPAHAHKLRRLVEFCQAHTATVVSDPYRGEPADFEHVLDLVEDACAGVLQHVQSTLGTS